MQYLKTWQQRWGLPDQAMMELQSLWGLGAEPTISVLPGDSESVVQQKVRFQAAQAGTRLWRNNVGVMINEQGIPVRYGLANESKKMNTFLKSSDLIGITPTVVNGTTYGVFTAYECKHANWTYSGSNREVAQKRYIDLVISLGGIARFVK